MSYPDDRNYFKKSEIRDDLFLEKNIILKETITQSGTTQGTTQPPDPFYSAEIGMNTSIYAASVFDSTNIKGLSWFVKVYPDTLAKTLGSVVFTLGKINLLYSNAVGFYFFIGGAANVSANSTLVADQWYHMVLNYNDINI